MANHIPPSAAHSPKLSGLHSALLRAAFRARTLLLIGALTIVLALLASMPWAGGSPTAAQDGEAEVPAKPTGLILESEMGSLGVAAQWDDVVGADDYLVRWRLPGPDQEMNEGVRTQSSDATITVADYGQWVVRVEGCNDAGCGPGVSKTVLVRQAKPGQPQNLVVSVRPGELDLTASWDAVEGAASYNIGWRRPTGNFAVGHRVTATDANAAFTVPDYGQWVVRVEGCNDAGCGPGANQQLAVEPEPPAIPTGLSLEAEHGSLDVSVDWDDVSGADDYLVRWRLPGLDQAMNEGVRTQSSEATITVSDYGRWTVRVEACNAGGCGPGVSKTVRLRQAKPGQPQNLGVNVTPGELDLTASWDAVEGAASYQIRWRLPTGNFEADNQVTTTDANAAFTAPDYGQWVVRVEACNAAGCGPGATISATVHPVEYVLPVCDRTPVVRDGILAKIPDVTDCAEVTDEHLALITGDLLVGRQGITALNEGDFDGLSSLNGLVLQHSELTTLPERVFDDLTNLRWLRLNDNGLTELPSGVFSNLTELERLYLGSNDLTTLRADLFASNSNLVTLHLNNNDLTQLPTGLFDGLSGLETLRLNENSLTTLPAGLFKDLSSIDTLWRDDAVNPRLCERSQEEQTAILEQLADISDCRLVTDGDLAPVLAATPAAPICERTPVVRDAVLQMTSYVSDCAAVTEGHLAFITGDLLLASSDIAALKVGDFGGLSNLNGLNLRYNRLISLPTGLFEDLEKLSWLRLNDNRLTTLDANTFSGLHNLRFVTLGSNNLRTIPPELLAAHTRLHTVVLYNNELTTIPAGAFDGLVDIHTVHLNGNKMTGLPAGLFHDLTALTELNLDDAVNPRVCSWSDQEKEDLLRLLPRDDITCRQVTDGDIAAAFPTAGVCGRTPAVRTAIVSRVPGVHDCAAVTDEHLAAVTGNIDLSYRGLAALQAEDLAGLSKLEGLSLRYNQLNSLPDGTFDDLAALTWLKIDNNRLADLPADVFSELDNLGTLWLNNNRLSAAPAGLFDGLDTLTVLYMYTNDFSTLPAGLFKDLTSLDKLWLDHAVNPGLCGYPQEEQDAILGQLPDISDCRLVTDSDVSLALAALSSLSVCERTPVVRDGILAKIPDVTDCAEVTDEHLALITGDLLVGRQGITALNEGDFDGLSSLNGLVLQHSDLTTLPERVFDDLTNLRWLRLNDNGLTELPSGVFSNLTELERLYLGSNDLTTLRADLFASNSNLVTLHLNNNDLTQLPTGLFDGLSGLETLRLNENSLTTLPAGLFKDLSSIDTLWRDDAVNPRLCERSQEEQTAILEQLADISDCKLVTDSDIDSLSLPNIILIMADDLGYGDLGSYGQATIKTPELDAMAVSGMRFTDFYAGHTICPPSREALLTGMHTGHTAIRGGIWFRDERFCDARTNLGQMLQFAGYRTAIIGKWGLGDEGTPAQPNDLGFDDFYGYLYHGFAHNSYPDMLYRNKEQIQLANSLQRARSYSNGGGWTKGKVEFSQDLFMAEALKFIEETSDTGQPFFLYLPLTPPHANTAATGYSQGIMETPPDGYGQYADESWDHAMKSYAAMVSYLDKDVGRLLDKLRELGIANDTVTFFTSDNGPHEEGDYRPEYFDSAGPFRGFKGRLYEGGIRVPLIAHWPGKIAAGSESDHVSALWDFMPTLAEIAGAPAPKGDGLSMLPTLQGEGDQSEHEYLYWRYFRAQPHYRIINGRRDRDWTRSQYWVDEKAVRWGDWKAIESVDKGTYELYDLASDPGETTDVAGDNPDVVKKMKEIIAEAHVEKSEVRAGFCYIK